jgi:SAM-dependent methyltransferase
MTAARAQLYSSRHMTELYPDLDRLYDEAFNHTLTPAPPSDAELERMLVYLGRLIALGPSAPLVVLGCGPQPHMLRYLISRGYKAVGVEPVRAFVRSAQTFLRSDESVVQGTAESIPLPDASVQLVYCNSVLEHVDSAAMSLREMARILRPGGVAWVVTTNRFRVSLRGDNSEYSVPFLNWFPAILRECFAFHHLHYAPWLANYTDRPAVHWFSYSELCQLGRDAGFAHFYAITDLLRPEDAPLARSRLRRWAVDSVQRSPWLRALALTVTALGGTTLMVKRASAAAPPAADVIGLGSLPRN